MRRLERRQYGAAVLCILGLVLLVGSVVLTLCAGRGIVGVAVGAVGGMMMLTAQLVNSRIADRIKTRGYR